MSKIPNDSGISSMAANLAGSSLTEATHWFTRTMADLGSIYGGLSGKTKADFGAGTAKYVTFLNVLENVEINPREFGSVNVGPHEAQNVVRIGDVLFNGTSETPGELAMGA
ncbi:MAG: hypothetical protein ACR2OU_06680 [Thermomicrobiales bacterium]